MSFDEKFGADLSDRFFNDTFKDAKVAVKIELLGDANYNSQGAAIVSTFDGEGFNLNPTQSDRANFEQGIDFKVKVKASEVGFKPSVNKCNFYIEQRCVSYDNVNLESLGTLIQHNSAIVNNNAKHQLVKFKAESITTNTLGAVHTIIGVRL